MTRRPRQLEEAARRRTGRGGIPLLEVRLACDIAADIVVVPHVAPTATPLEAKTAQAIRRHQEQLRDRLLYERGHSLTAIGQATGRPARTVQRGLAKLEQRAEVGTPAHAKLRVAQRLVVVRSAYMVRR